MVKVVVVIRTKENIRTLKEEERKVVAVTPQKTFKGSTS